MSDLDVMEFRFPTIIHYYAIKVRFSHAVLVSNEIKAYQNSVFNLCSIKIIELGFYYEHVSPYIERFYYSLIELQFYFKLNRTLVEV